MPKKEQKELLFKDWYIIGSVQSNSNTLVGDRFSLPNKINKKIYKFRCSAIHQNKNNLTKTITNKYTR